MNVGCVDRLVANVIDFQLATGASAVITPYVHIGSATDGWSEVQALLFRRSRRYLDERQIRLPVIAPIALSWRLLGRTQWAGVLDRLVVALNQLGPTEVALAGSKVHSGVHADHRLADMYAATAHLSRSWPIIAWRQGLFGEACVAAGAVAYESGIGWGETCDLPQRMSGHRSPPSDGFGARPVYVDRLGLSLPKRTVQALISDGSLAARLTHMNMSCCPTGGEPFLATRAPMQ